MPTFGSLFAGIGGLDLGLERAGWTCRWQVEIDPFCQRVLAKHWPDVRRYADVVDFPSVDTEPVDLICGGFPCQPVSVAGKRLAQADARWLWPEFGRIVRALQPRLVLVENVSGLLGRGLGDVLGDLASLGFDAEWTSIDAAAVGAPHERTRVFVLAYVDGAGRPHPQGRTRPAESKGRQESRAGVTRQGPPAWLPEPAVVRVVDRLSPEVDGNAVRALGNAVVPQVAEWIGRRLMALR